MGTYLALLEGPGVDADVVFDYINEGKVVQFVNSLFKDMHDQWCRIPSDLKPLKFELYTSHGLRHQAVEDMTDNANISFAAAAARAGILLDSFNNLFRYISGSKGKDMKCARSLAGWPDVNQGGKCPSIDSIPTEDRLLFRGFIAKLFEFAPDCVRQNAGGECLGLILLKSFEDIFEHRKLNGMDGGKPELINAMVNALEFARNDDFFPEKKLLYWSSCVQREFRRMNAWSVDSTKFNEGETVTAFA
jgi:hypothetical protein